MPRLIVKKSIEAVSSPVPVPPEQQEPPKRVIKRVLKKVVRSPPPTSIPEVSKLSVADLEASDPLTAYQVSFTDRDRVVLAIARDHLGTSFCMERSVGFVTYLANGAKEGT
jgi:hypothetical protein